METVLVGRFENGTMIAAKLSKIIGERCHRGIKEIKVAKPKSWGPIFKYSRPTPTSIGDQPKVMDPFTKKNIYIHDGKMDDGVFAKKNLIEGDIVMYYSGLMWNNTEVPLFRTNQTWDEKYE